MQRFPKFSDEDAGFLLDICKKITSISGDIEYLREVQDAFGGVNLPQGADKDVITFRTQTQASIEFLLHQQEELKRLLVPQAREVVDRYAEMVGIKDGVVIAVNHKALSDNPRWTPDLLPTADSLVLKTTKITVTKVALRLGVSGKLEVYVAGEKGQSETPKKKGGRQSKNNHDEKIVHFLVDDDFSFELVED